MHLINDCDLPVQEVDGQPEVSGGEVEMAVPVPERTKTPNKLATLLLLKLELGSSDLSLIRAHLRRRLSH